MISIRRKRPTKRQKHDDGDDDDGDEDEENSDASEVLPRKRTASRSSSPLSNLSDEEDGSEHQSVEEGDEEEGPGTRTRAKVTFLLLMCSKAYKRFISSVGESKEEGKEKGKAKRFLNCSYTKTLFLFFLTLSYEAASNCAYVLHVPVISGCFVVMLSFISLYFVLLPQMFLTTVLYC